MKNALKQVTLDNKDTLTIVKRRGWFSVVRTKEGATRGYVVNCGLPSFEAAAESLTKEANRINGLCAFLKKN